MKAGDLIHTRRFGQHIEGFPAFIIDQEAQKVWNVWLMTDRGSFICRLYEHEFYSVEDRLEELWQTGENVSEFRRLTSLQTFLELRAP